MKPIKISNLRTSHFENLSFDLSEPGLYGIIGRNGAGKSSLFSLLSGETSFSDGDIRIGRVSYVPSLEIFDKHLSANDYINLLSSQERNVCHRYLDALGGDTFLNQPIGKYSLGMKELFALVYSLSLQSDVVILDELLDGLDEQRRFTAYGLLKQCSQDKIILLTSHNLSEVFETCDQVFLLDRKAIRLIDDLKSAQETIFL